jgi:hypothetical protein
MIVDTVPWWAWLVPVAVSAPWIAGIAYYWRHRPRDRSLPPSMADLARKRLWTP